MGQLIQNKDKDKYSTFVVYSWFYFSQNNMSIILASLCSTLHKQNDHSKLYNSFVPALQSVYFASTNKTYNPMCY